MFWDAYTKLRALAPRDEEVAVGVEVSVHTVRAWDLAAEKSRDVDHKRFPSYFNRQRLARFADSLGAPKRVVEALRSDDPKEVRA